MGGGVTPYTICGGAVHTRHGTIYTYYCRYEGFIHNYNSTVYIYIYVYIRHVYFLDMQARSDGGERISST